MSSSSTVKSMSGRRDRASSVTIRLPGRCWMVNTKVLTYAHHRWKHGPCSRLVFNQARALESVMTLKGTPDRN